MSDDIHVFICTGCGIGEAIDVEALGELVNEEFKAKPRPPPHTGRGGLSALP